MPRLLLSVGLVPLILLNGCGLLPHFKPSAKRIFISYFPPATDSGRLRLGVKDNIDVKGVVTTAGSQYFAKHHPPAKRDAPALAIARRRNVDIVGKTNLSEFAASPSGINEYFGTPRNPLSHWRNLLPGGSSSGSAAAVAAGLADVAFGTDTAGSVRVPAACCGVVGLKTTYGLVPLEGIYPISAEHLDTVGPLGKDIAHTVEGMELLEEGFAKRYAAARAAHPTAATIRIGRLRLKGTDQNIDDAVDAALTRTGFQVVPLSDDLRELWEQAKKDGNTIAAAGVWLSDRRYSSSPEVSVRTKSAILVGRLAYDDDYWAAVHRKRAWQQALAKVFKKVDLIALPTLQSPPPAFPVDFKVGLLEARVLNLQNTVPVNFAGNPALAVPIPLHHAIVHATSLQLIGPNRSEAELLNAGRMVEGAVKKR